MFTSILSIIPTNSNISIIAQLQYIVQLVFIAFLGSTNIEIVKTEQPFYHFLSVRPCIFAVVWRIHTKIECSHI